MANFCLRPEAVTAFRAAVVDGRINPEKLSQLSSDERRALFKGIVGEDGAKEVNAQFEAKSLLKNQQRGYITWARNTAGLKPEVRNELEDKINKLDRVLNPSEEKAFLSDLAEKKLGVGVSTDEAKQISDLSTKVQEAKSNIKPDSTFATQAQRLQYGRAKIALNNYVGDLKADAGKLKLSEIKDHPIQAVSNVAGVSKAVAASMDDSAIFRQGWKTLLTNPIKWQNNARKTFSDAVRQFGGKPVMDEINAEILSRPNAINGTYKKMGLAIGNTEEPFPSTLPEKIPVFNRLYKASESAYTGFVYRQRADIADKYLNIMQKSGVPFDDKNLKATGKLVNSLTGRGSLGRFEGSAANAVNNIFFSPRFIKSNLDTLTAHQFQKGVTPFVRKKAAINLVKIISGTAAILATAEAIKPGSVDWDPRSSDFGRIRIGDTRFDVTGGQNGIVTLAGRLINGNTKNSSTGVVTPLNGQGVNPSKEDEVVDFFTNKLSPAAGVVRDVIQGHDFNNNKATPINEAKNAFEPIPFQNLTQPNTANQANKLATYLADSLGVSANTYAPSSTNWNLQPGKAQSAFKDKVGQQKFNEANQDYNNKVNQVIQTLQSNPTYKALPSDQKQAVLTAAKTKIENNVFKDYGFKYAQQRAKASKTKKATLSSVGL